MKTIQVQALTAENFARYGEFQNLLDDASLASKSVFPYGSFADVVKLDLGGGNLPTVSVCQVKNRRKTLLLPWRPTRRPVKACCRWMTMW